MESSRSGVVKVRVWTLKTGCGAWWLSDDESFFPPFSIKQDCGLKVESSVEVLVFDVSSSTCHSYTNAVFGGCSNIMTYKVELPIDDTIYLFLLTYCDYITLSKNPSDDRTLI